MRMARLLSQNMWSRLTRCDVVRAHGAGELQMDASFSDCQMTTLHNLTIHARQALVDVRVRQ